MSAISFFMPNLEATNDFARKIAGLCNEGDAILLFGEVGSGKTSFARSFVRTLGSDETNVTSPTFTLIQYYIGKHGEKIYHSDLYRLKHKSELEELGLWENMENSINLIEWAEMIEEYLPNALKIYMSINGDGREAKLVGNETWQKRLKNL